MAGLRERKKRQTRLHISDTATGLFLERGFDAVTIAEIADASDVSVNTVYNYFPAKEELFFDRESRMVELPAGRVRERRLGESAAEALLRGLRDDVAERRPEVGLAEGYARFARVVQESPTLVARVMRMEDRTADCLADALRAEAGAGPDDHEPELIAAQLMTVQRAVFRTVGIATADGWSVAEMALLVLRKIDTAESLLSSRVRGYARRAAGGGAHGV